MADLILRQLVQSDLEDIHQHFQRLDETALRMRFFRSMKPRALRDYVNATFSKNGVMFGAFQDGVIRGVGELFPSGRRGLSDADAALSVEREFRGLGLGDALFKRLVLAAKNRLVRSLHFQCLPDNVPLLHLARKHGAVVTRRENQAEATIHPELPSVFSVSAELIAELRGNAVVEAPMASTARILQNSGRAVFQSLTAAPLRAEGLLYPD